MKKPLPQADTHFLKIVEKIFTPLEWYFRYEAKNLERIPKKGACLVVMNHGIIPFHGFLLAKKMFDQFDLPVRGLGASFLFEVPLLREFFLKGGAVEASPENAQQLLDDGCCIMLAPGGIYEALITQPGMHRIPWERREGFVKLACKNRVPIIPTYCTGIDKVYFNSQFLLRYRIKFLEKTRFSLPIFWGLGILPFPIKLTHYVGKAIDTKPKRGETLAKTVKRVHGEVLIAMQRLTI